MVRFEKIVQINSALETKKGIRLSGCLFGVDVLLQHIADLAFGIFPARRYDLCQFLQECTSDVVMLIAQIFQVASENANGFQFREAGYAGRIRFSAADSRPAKHISGVQVGERHFRPIVWFVLKGNGPFCDEIQMGGSVSVFEYHRIRRGKKRRKERRKQIELFASQVF